MTASAAIGIGTEPRPLCHVCGSRGRGLYIGLRDRLLAAPGEWRFVQCPAPDCGLLWLDPMPLAQDLVTAHACSAVSSPAAPAVAGEPRRFRRRVREGYLARSFLRESAPEGRGQRWLGLLMYLRPLRRAEIDAAVMHLRLMSSGGRLLDIGCGSGEGLRELARVGWRVGGLDIDPSAVALARGRGLDVCLGTLEGQAYASGSFDAVTMSHSIEHVADPSAVLREVDRILLPGGRLAILTPNARSLGQRWFQSSWFALDPPRHLYVFTLPALSRLLEAAGFHVTRAFTSPRGADLILSASRSIQRTGRAGLDSPGGPRIASWARAAQWLEWLGRRIVASLGEEIVIVAEKPRGHDPRASASSADR